MASSVDLHLSYPPPFRQSHSHPKEDEEVLEIQSISGEADIPTIDLEDLDPSRLGEACRNWGVFRLANHGIPASLSSHLHAESSALLSLPFDSKVALFDHSYSWGTPAGSLAVKNTNWVEALHLPLSLPNPPTTTSPSFGCLVEDYGRHMVRIARTLFVAMSSDLKLDDEIAKSYLSDSDGFLRIYRYPSCPDVSKHFGMDAHTDSSAMSVLNQDDVGGLQILRDGQWLHVAPVSGTLVVNLGDMIQAISSDEYKSVQHRVMANRSRVRISLCYFAFPRGDGVIFSSKYKAFTYNEFRKRVQEDIKASGSKVGLDRFRITDQS